MPGMKIGFRWLWIVGVIAALMGGYWGLIRDHKDAGGKKPPFGGPFAAPVEAASVQTADIDVEVDAVGSLIADESVIIRSEIAGKIQSIHFSDGQPVSKDDLLSVIDPSEYSAQLDQIRATVELDQLNVDRAKPLLDAQGISRQRYDELAAKLKESRAKLALAQVFLDKTQIRAPFSGRLGMRQISPGEYVQPGKAIVNLESIQPIKVDFRIPELYGNQIRLGQTVLIRVDTYPDRTFKGRIEAIDPRIDETTRTLQLRALLRNEESKLRPGMFTHVTVLLGRRNEAKLIPEQALVPMGGDQFVFRIVEGKAALTKVRIGQRREGRVEIVEGLGAHDQVVTAGQMKLHDGAPVRVKDGGANDPGSNDTPPRRS
jgi:membrane fusion protein (multidrug efflux system)